GPKTKCRDCHDFPHYLSIAVNEKHYDQREDREKDRLTQRIFAKTAIIKWRAEKILGPLFPSVFTLPQPTSYY
ncbi:hypothetical protein, partial [Klebsiella pneumoniae]|uniref:hypothetical protein n=1 Tax=Klebsiella pneumoniae TaxID=573 RepID=UPI001C9AF098